MNDKKIEYLKRNLEQALQNQKFSEINHFYHELLKLVDPNEISELTQQVNQYNKIYTEQSTKQKNTTEQALKARIRKTKRRYERNIKTRKLGLLGGTLAMILGCILVMHGAGAFGSYDDFTANIGIFVSAIGFILVIVGTFSAAKVSTLETKLSQCRKEVFAYLCQQESKLQYLQNVETTQDDYVGQLKDSDPHGFGVCLRLDTTIYAGQWENGWPSGVGKLYTDDLSMMLEGEFDDDKIHGIVDIQWDDGAEWHGEYRDGVPWNGSGKAYVNETIQYGTWQNGVLISK